MSNPGSTCLGVTSVLSTSISSSVDGNNDRFNDEGLVSATWYVLGQFSYMFWNVVTFEDEETCFW